MKNKLVSIVLPTYNGSKFIKDSLESILSQTYQNWELIIVNDCSTDNTLEICKEFALQDSRIKIYTNNENKKLPASLNIGFNYAIGEYFTWTSDDNMYKSDAIEKMVNALDENVDYDLVSFSMDYIDEDGNFLYSAFSKLNRTELDLIEGNNIGACFMYRKSVTENIGEYDVEMFCAEDYDYWCRIALSGKILYLSENLYLYRTNSSSLTATKRDIIDEKTIEIKLKYAHGLFNKYKLNKKEVIEKVLDLYFIQKNNEWLSFARLIDEVIFKKILFKKRLKYFFKKIFSIKKIYSRGFYRIAFTFIGITIKFKI